MIPFDLINIKITFGTKITKQNALEISKEFSSSPIPIPRPVSSQAIP